ncbi:MAG: hypothetical protein WCW52_05615 [Elusimicrobiales bacterium]|jgi:DNA mismatch repair ATPase MutS
MDKAFIFAEFDAFYAFYRPLTPYGRLARAALPFYDSAETLNREYDLTERFIAFIKKSRVQADRLEFHLKNMPVMPEDPPRVLNAAEIFLFKKFLSNTKAAFAALPSEIRKPLAAVWRSDELLNTLNLGGAGESFHLADAYAPELKTAREKLTAAGAELARIREEKLKGICKTYDLDFTKREFLVVDEARARKAYGSPDLFFEAYDSAGVIARPIFGPAYLELTAVKEKLHAEERAAEQKVLRELSALIKKEKEPVAGYLQAVERADVLLAKARLALEYGMTRPGLKKFPSPPALKNARFIPLETRLKALKLKYTPFSFKFSRRVNILRGSNMGGKTVALKTLAFTQLLAQTGFFVPAEAYDTCVYAKVHVAGDEETGRAEGLSSFGLEMNAFVRAYADTGKPCLIFMDEFAKTTNSDEAAALLSAISEDFCGNEQVLAFIATHFARLAPRRNAAFLRMKGFDNAAFSAYFLGRTPVELTEKLKMLNKFMDYEITNDTGPGGGIHDAIKIAGILGVNGRIIDRARDFMAAAGKTKPAEGGRSE